MFSHTIEGTRVSSRASSSSGDETTNSILSIFEAIRGELAVHQSLAAHCKHKDCHDGTTVRVCIAFLEVACKFTLSQ
jgi:hypothetical protein